jgi:hypothetical protein
LNNLEDLIQFRFFLSREHFLLEVNPSVGPVFRRMGDRHIRIQTQGKWSGQIGLLLFAPVDRIPHFLYL